MNLLLLLLLVVLCGALLAETADISEGNATADRSNGTEIKPSGSCPSGCHGGPPSSPGSSSCFSVENEVMTEEGAKKLKHLRPGDKILTVSHEGEIKFEEMIADGHLVPEVETWFYKISVGGKSIMLTPGHYVYTGEDIERSHLLRADQIKRGDNLLTTSDSTNLVADSTNLDPDSTNLVADSTNLDPDSTNLDADPTNLVVKRVDKVEKVLSRGISNPLLPSGRILVEGILASVYSDEFRLLSVAQQHGCLWMIRQIRHLTPDTFSSLLGDVLPSLLPYLEVIDKHVMLSG